jgi:inorganic pyrophosphatase
MIHPWHDNPPGPTPPDLMTVVVEIPRGSRNKYELDKQSGLFRLDRVLYSAVHYPGDYGFFPRTYALDNDPLDALVMVTVPTFSGCAIEVRPIGMFVMRDRGEMDEKVLCVPTHDPLYADYAELTDVPAHFLREVEHFFRVYKDLEGARVKALGWEGLEKTRQTIEESIERYHGLRGELDPGRAEPRTRPGLEL